MKERPILFSGPMVRAILEGRKTMTRRVVKPQPEHSGDPCECWTDGKCALCGDESGVVVSPYGKPGDRLWVREAMHSDGDDWWFPASEAGGEFDFPIDGNEYRSDVLQWMKRQRSKLRTYVPSIFMPRWACRVIPEIVSVRVERLQDISERDAESEGIDFLRHIPDCDETLTARQLFWCLWDSINEKRGFGWDANPWVWVIEFKRAEDNKS